MRLDERPNRDLHDLVPATLQMTACFIVVAHRAPEQLARLAGRLAPHHLLIHIDARLPEAAFAGFEHALAKHDNVTFLRRHRSSWASWGLVEAPLEGLRTAIARGGWTHVMHISGQDYPLHSAAEISAFFDRSIGTSFIHHWSLPDPTWGKDGGMFRLRYWHMPLFKRRFFVPIPRRLPSGLRFFGSSAFWCLTPETTADLLEFVDRRPDVTRFYRHVWIADEQFVATAVLNGPYASSVRNESLTYIRWPDEPSPHPIDFTMKNVSSLSDARFGKAKDSGPGPVKLFARKLDLATGPDLFDYLDDLADGRRIDDDRIRSFRRE